VPSPQPPKYQVIYAAMRDQILSGALPPGQQLPSQQEMAESHKTSLMTLRQAMAGLEADGLIVVAAGRGTWVADRPIDVRVGNLSSFASAMQAAGIALSTEIVSVVEKKAGQSPEAEAALATPGPLTCLMRRRSMDGAPFSLQRSFLTADLGAQINFDDLVDESLYRSIEVATGWSVSTARETIRAVRPSRPDAALLDVKPSEPSLLSIRTSVNQFDVPFLYDEAILIGDRCTIVADRSSDHLRISYGLDER